MSLVPRATVLSSRSHPPPPPKQKRSSLDALYGFSLVEFATGVPLKSIAKARQATDFLPVVAPAHTAANTILPAACFLPQSPVRDESSRANCQPGVATNMGPWMQSDLTVGPQPPASIYVPVPYPYCIPMISHGQLALATEYHIPPSFPATTFPIHSATSPPPPPEKPPSELSLKSKQTSKTRVSPEPSKEGGVGRNIDQKPQLVQCIVCERCGRHRSRQHQDQVSLCRRCQRREPNLDACKCPKSRNLGDPRNEEVSHTTRERGEHERRRLRDRETYVVEVQTLPKAQKHQRSCDKDTYKERYTCYRCHQLKVKSPTRSRKATLATHENGCEEEKPMFVRSGKNRGKAGDSWSSDTAKRKLHRTNEKEWNEDSERARSDSDTSPHSIEQKNYITMGYRHVKPFPVREPYSGDAIANGQRHFDISKVDPAPRKIPTSLHREISDYGSLVGRSAASALAPAEGGRPSPTDTSKQKQTPEKSESLLRTIGRHVRPFVDPTALMGSKSASKAHNGYKKEIISSNERQAKKTRDEGTRDTDREQNTARHREKYPENGANAELELISRVRATELSPPPSPRMRSSHRRIHEDHSLNASSAISNEAILPAPRIPVNPDPGNLRSYSEVAMVDDSEDREWWEHSSSGSDRKRSKTFVDVREEVVLDQYGMPERYLRVSRRRRDGRGE